MTACDACRAALSDVLAGLESSPAAEEHLASCAECRDVLQDLVWQDLAIGELAGRERTREILARWRGAVPRRRWGLWIAAAAVALLATAVLLLQRPPAPPAVVITPEKPKPAPTPMPPAPELPPPAPPIPTPPPQPPKGEAPRPAPEAPPAPPPPPKVEPPPAAPAPPPLPPTRAAIAKLRVEGRGDHDLLEDARVEAQSRAIVEFPDGTKLELRRGTTISKLSAAGGKRVALDQGGLKAEVAAQPKDQPMIFATPQGEAAVLGTTLRLSVDEKATRVDVLHGQVRLKRTSDGRAATLAAGQTAIAAEGKAPPTARKLLPPLDELAGAMSPGTWAELETDGFDLRSLEMRPWQHLLEDVEEAKWDPVERQLHLLGFVSKEFNGYMVFDVKTNAWERRKCPPGETWFGPAYDHVAFDPAARALFFRQHNHFVVHQLDLRTMEWAPLPEMPSNPAEIGALELFPELGGLVFVGGGNVFLYRFKTKRWEILARLLEIGRDGAFAEYDPSRHVLLFGGRSALYRLDAAGNITALKEPPIPLGLKDALVVADAGKLWALARPDGRAFHEYDVAQNRWTALEPPPLPVMRAARESHTAAAPIPGEGVILFLAADESAANVYAYRHRK